MKKTLSKLLIDRGMTRPLWMFKELVKLLLQNSLLKEQIIIMRKLKSHLFLIICSSLSIQQLEM